MSSHLFSYSHSSLAIPARLQDACGRFLPGALAVQSSSSESDTDSVPSSPSVQSTDDKTSLVTALLSISLSSPTPSSPSSLSSLSSSMSGSNSGEGVPSSSGIGLGGIILTNKQFEILLNCGLIGSPCVEVPTPPPPPPVAPVAASMQIPTFISNAASSSATSESLLDLFPNVPRATILEIIQFTFHPLNLNKLDLSAHEKVHDVRSSIVLENDNITVKETRNCLRV
ncbi:hypothetical protein JR316_0004179 [Psilocybe cubensis]|uniref:Uncharacterized protein n=2 Tax=Psilocybe cubensis TaxID=181762 RepID=A0ACB8H302_PSICU|nr:hypothetical protein JR316_0004179 [Psilocybe cubensis]KAH9482084.1 hypothetical protein JR316_0004179 [Psilocybe cubensis]